jgi:hypothetical protein
MTYPPEVVQALKEALRHAYWYKSDLRLFLSSLDLPRGLATKQAWHDEKEYKVRIVSKVLDELVSMGPEGVGPMRRLIRGVLDIPNFNHLRSHEDGPKLVQNARRAVEILRELATRHDEELRQRTEKSGERKARAAETLHRRNELVGKLQADFFALAAHPDERQRGLMFEPFLRELFAAHDLDPRGSFRLIGEQIDGAFEFEGTHYLLEARWEAKFQGARPLRAFAETVSSRLDNTLGLFVALGGFSDDGLQAFKGSRPRIVLWDGEDLAVVLQGLIDFRDLLKRKVRHASHTGNPYLKARDIISG